MVTLRIKVSGDHDISVPNVDLVQNSVGVYACMFELPDDYENQICKAVFKNEILSNAYEETLTYYGTSGTWDCEIPKEVLKNVGKLFIGVYMTSPGGLEIRPTVWSAPMNIVAGTSIVNLTSTGGDEI